MKIVREHIDEAIKHLAPKAEEDFDLPPKLMELYFAAKKLIGTRGITNVKIGLNEWEPIFRIMFEENNSLLWHLKVAAINRREDAVLVQTYNAELKNYPDYVINTLDELIQIIDKIQNNNM